MSPINNAARMPHNPAGQQAHQAQAMRGHPSQHRIMQIPPQLQTQPAQMPHRSQAQSTPIPQRSQMQTAQRAQQPQAQRGAALPRLTNNDLENPFSAPLPDGVKLVPLDESTMKNLHSIGVNPPANTGSPTPSSFTQPVANAPATPTNSAIEPEQSSPTEIISIPAPPVMIDSLTKFIQNERNGAIFYSNLAKKTRSQEFQNHIAKISGNCNTRREKLDNLYLRQRGEAFSTDQSAIELSATFTDGLRSAITQETAAIHELTCIHEANTEPAIGKLIDNQIYSKLADIALLNMMLFNG